MKKVIKNATPYLKMRILGAIDLAPGKTIKERVQKVAEMQFTDEDGNLREFTWRTISTWLYRYKKHGITSVDNKPRSDKGKTRKISPETLLEAINQVLPYFRKKYYNKRDLYRKCLELGIFTTQDLAQTTFYRLVKEHELLKDDTPNNKRRLAFAMQYANQLWQMDTMFGPNIKNSAGKSIPTKLIAFIDDASRVICHGEFFFNENTSTLITGLRSAFYKRGIPEQLYADNGAIYTSKELTLTCARIGTILRHAPVRDGAAKGKIERFFLTVRKKFLNRNIESLTIEKINKLFNTWLEEEYNNKIHSAIGMKPIDRFGLDLKRIKFLEPSQISDELFYFEEDRKVKKDNTFPCKSKRYEVPADLRDKTIQIRYDKHNPNSPIIVYYKGQRIGQARKLNLIANSTMKRHKEDFS